MTIIIGKQKIKVYYYYYYYYYSYYSDLFSLPELYFFFYALFFVFVCKRVCYVVFMYVLTLIP